VRQAVVAGRLQHLRACYRVGLGDNLQHLRAAARPLSLRTRPLQASDRTRCAGRQPGGAAPRAARHARRRGAARRRTEERAARPKRCVSRRESAARICPRRRSAPRPPLHSAPAQAPGLYSSPKAVPSEPLVTPCEQTQGFGTRPLQRGGHIICLGAPKPPRSF